MNFASDNAVGASPLVLDALLAANHDAVPAYGQDPFSERARQLLNDIFEREVTSFFVPSGTASNTLALHARRGAVFRRHSSRSGILNGMTPQRGMHLALMSR